MDFFYHNFVFLFIYLVKYKFIFIKNYDKFLFFKKFSLKNKKFFFYHEFILKADCISFFLYRRYIEYFRMFRYNEYLSNDKTLFLFPKIKNILHQY